jgi:hypothetical protein
MDPRASELADQLDFAAARLKTDTIPPTLSDFPAGTPRAARLGETGPDAGLDRFLNEPVALVADARDELRAARMRLARLTGELGELWPGGGALPPAA